MTIKEILNKNIKVEWITILSRSNATSTYCKNIKYLTERQLNMKVKKYKLENDDHIIVDNR